MTPLATIARRLCRELAPLRFEAPVTHVYNPHEYAWRPFERYLELYGGGTKEVLLLGMNPGPFGMAQTGVPFGEVAMVRDWLRIEARVDKPAHEHPKRVVLGFACPRSEVSGQRLWGWAQQRFATPKRFFTRFWVHNYCPLVFMEASGRNVTPDKLRAGERRPLLAACDSALRDVVVQTRPQWVIGVGLWAEQRARAALVGVPRQFGRLPHPSTMSSRTARRAEQRSS